MNRQSYLRLICCMLILVASSGLKPNGYNQVPNQTMSIVINEASIAESGDGSSGANQTLVAMVDKDETTEPGGSGSGTGGGMQAEDETTEPGGSGSGTGGGMQSEEETTEPGGSGSGTGGGIQNGLENMDETSDWDGFFV